MKTKTPKTDAKWSKLCRNVQSWYQIAEEMKLYCCQKERKLTAVTEQRDEAQEQLTTVTKRYDSSKTETKGYDLPWIDFTE